MLTSELAALKLKSIAGTHPERPVAINAGELRQLCEAAQASQPKAPAGPQDSFGGYDGAPRPSDA